MVTPPPVRFPAPVRDDLNAHRPGLADETEQLFAAHVRPCVESLWPLREPPWFEYDQFFPDGYNADGFDEFHRMLGHKNGGLDEHYGFTAPPGCSEDIAAYECLLRLTYDNAAGFAWGTNWVYVLVPAEDLARGDLGRLVVTGANS